MIFLSSFLHALVSPFKTQAQLEAEIVVLRHQLNVLRRRIIVSGLIMVTAFNTDGNSLGLV